MKKISLKNLATVKRISLFNTKNAYLTADIDKFNKKIKSKNNINKLKVDSKKKPVIDTG